MAEPKRKATYDDVLAAPEHKVAEIIDGELILSPRPAHPHARASTLLGAEVLRLGADARWVIAAVHGGGDEPRPEPFAAVELDLARLWLD